MLPEAAAKSASSFSQMDVQARWRRILLSVSEVHFQVGGIKCLFSSIFAGAPQTPAEALLECHARPRGTVGGDMKSLILVGRCSEDVNRFLE